MGESNEIKLAIVGQLRSGKSTLADYATKRYNFKQFAFGDTLKRYAHELFLSVPREPKPRKLYQDFGQLMRQIDNNVWVDKCLIDVGLHLFRERKDYQIGFVDHPPRVIVTDCRQPNEYERLKAEGFTFIRVNAPVDLRLERARSEGDSFAESDLTHETEVSIGNYEVDYEIDNDGTVRELCRKFDEVMGDLLDTNTLER